jgi:hypothetical protein
MIHIASSRAGAASIGEQWQASTFAMDDTGAWCKALVDLAADVMALYGSENQYLDLAHFSSLLLRASFSPSSFKRKKRKERGE